LDCWLRGRRDLDARAPAADRAALERHVPAEILDHLPERDTDFTTCGHRFNYTIEERDTYLKPKP